MALSAREQWLEQWRQDRTPWFRFDGRKDSLEQLRAGRSARKVHLIRATELHLRELAAFPQLRELSL